MWKVLLLAVFSIGVFGEYTINDIPGYQNLASQQYREAFPAFDECMKDLLVIDFARDEIRVIAPKGTIEEVVGKSCRKLPQINACVDSLLEMTSQQIKNGMPSYNVSDYKVAKEMLMNYICHNSGSRLTMFLQDGGFECITKQRAYLSCTNISIYDICAHYDEMTNCFLSTLRGCALAMSSNIAEDFFRYVRTETPLCSNII